MTRNKKGEQWWSYCKTRVSHKTGRLPNAHCLSTAEAVVSTWDADLHPILVHQVISPLSLYLPVHKTWMKFRPPSVSSSANTDEEAVRSG